MQPTNLTSLNFEDIKASIKTYLRTRDEFTDYDFEGSALSYLIDVLAYNTYYTSFTSNMLINESFIQSATIRGNIASLAKMLNYLPKSITSAKACIQVEVQTTVCSDGQFPSYVTLAKGPVLGAGSYQFNALTEKVAVVDNFGKAVFDKFLVYEGTVVEYEYTVDTFQRQRFVIPNEDVDIDTLQVFVRPNSQSTNIDSYIKVDDVTELNSTSRIYHISEGPDLRYELFFGDGVIGRKLQDGEVILLRYAISSGAAANDIQNFFYAGQLEDSCGKVYGSEDITITILERAQLGSDRETVESIKYNAPRWFASQNRAVTTIDYETIARKVYPATAAVVAFGGENVSPPTYGKVYLAVRSVTGSKLNDATKDDIAKGMQKYTVGALETVVVDPDYLYIIANIFATFDQNKTSLSNSEIQKKTLDAVDSFADQSGLNNFSGSFSSAKLIRAVSLADPSIEGVSVQVVLLKYIETEPNTENSHTIQFGTEILDSAPSNEDSICDKEPVLQGGPFYTADKPSTPQYFTDDGSGNIYSYIDDGGTKVVTDGNFGNVNYTTGEVTVGPVNIVGDANNPPEPIDPDVDTTNLDTISEPDGGTTPAADTTTPTATGANTYAITNDPLSIPVVAIPANANTILPTTPGTIMAFPDTIITIAPLGTTPPPSVPLNNINPGQFTTPPTVAINVPPVAGFQVGAPDIDGCF